MVKNFEQIMKDMVDNVANVPIEDLQAGSVVNTILAANKNAEVSQQLRKFLAKLNIKSARATHIEDLLLNSINNFGTPDQLYISPSLLDAFKKAFGDK